jgi:hypothetical protein
MVVGMRNSSRHRGPGLVVAVAASALLTACAGQSGSHGGTAAGSSSASSTAASSSSGPRTSPLTKGLLPAAAFGQANVVSMTLQQFKQATAGQLGQASGLQVTPPQCASALQTTQPDVDQVKDLVAESATQQGSATIEAIMSGSSVDGAADKLKTAMSSCPKIDISAPQLGTATLTFAPLDVSSVSDQAAGAQYTLTVTPPNHPAVTLPALIAVGQDHDRLVLLMTVAASDANATGGPPPAAPDTTAFTTLFGKAWSTEKKALD